MSVSFWMITMKITDAQYEYLMPHFKEAFDQIDFDIKNRLHTLNEWMSDPSSLSGRTVNIGGRDIPCIEAFSRELSSNCIQKLWYTVCDCCEPREDNVLHFIMNSGTIPSSILFLGLDPSLSLQLPGKLVNFILSSDEVKEWTDTKLKEHRLCIVKGEYLERIKIRYEKEKCAEGLLGCSNNELRHIFNNFINSFDKANIAGSGLLCLSMMAVSHCT